MTTPKDSTGCSNATVCSSASQIGHLGWIMRNALPRTVRTELYLLFSELAETNGKAVKWKLVFGESIREDGKIKVK
jgi:hypothetical protein